MHQLLDRSGGDRVKRRRRLVKQHDVRLYGDRPRDAEPLLLAAGEPERAVLQPVLDLVPKRGVTQRPLDALVEPRLHAQVSRRPGHVVEDRLRERVGLLEHHADPAAHLDSVDTAAVDVVTVVEDLALELESRDRVVHPVEASQERGFAAPGGTDHRRDQVPVDLQRRPADRAAWRRRRPTRRGRRKRSRPPPRGPAWPVPRSSPHDLTRRGSAAAGGPGILCARSGIPCASSAIPCARRGCRLPVLSLSQARTVTRERQPCTDVGDQDQSEQHERGAPRSCLGLWDPEVGRRIDQHRDVRNPMAEDE